MTEPRPAVPAMRYRRLAVAAAVAAFAVTAAVGFLLVRSSRHDDTIHVTDRRERAPALIGRPVDQATRTAGELGIEVRVEGSGPTVVRQSPAAGEAVPPGAVLTLTAG